MSDNSISVKKATLYTAGAKYSSVAMNLVFTMILARLLSPEEFGTVAVITVFISFFNLFADMGLGTGVIQNKELSDEEINDIFSFSVYQGLILALLFIGFSCPLSVFYEDPIYIKLGSLLSLSILFNSFNMIPNAMMLKNKKFKSIAFRTICVSFIVSCITVAFAYLGFGVYAIVLSSVFTAVGIFLWNQLTVKLRYRFVPQFSSVSKIWGYSVYQFLSMIINYFCRSLDQILCGKYLSKANLGQYNKSYSLMMMPISNIPSVINPVLHPILSEYQNEKKVIFAKYSKLLDFLSIISFFIAGFFFFAGREIILLMYGSQWEAAIAPFRFLSLSLWGQLLTNTTGTIYQSIGNTKLMFNNSIITASIIVSSIIIGIIIGSINSLAMSVSLGYMIVFFVSFYILVKIGFGMSYFHFLKRFAPNALMMSGILLTSLIIPTINNICLSLMTKVVACGILSIIFLRITHKDIVFREILKRT